MKPPSKWESFTDVTPTGFKRLGTTIFYRHAEETPKQTNLYGTQEDHKHIVSIEAFVCLSNILF